MTTLRDAAQQALEALAVATNCLDGYYIPRGKTTLPEIEDAIAALKAALAEPVQEPVCAHGVGKTKCSFCSVEDKQPVQDVKGCDVCEHPLYAGIKCRVCGRLTPGGAP